MLILNEFNEHTNILNSNNNNKPFYYLFITEWTNGLKLYFSYFTKNVLDDSKWILIKSGVDLFQYLPNTDNISKFSLQYLNFINYMASNINNWTNNNDNNIWQFDDPVIFSKLKCISSREYPQWNNQLISQCYIPSSNEDIPNIIYNIIVDLYYMKDNMQYQHIK